MDDTPKPKGKPGRPRKYPEHYTTAQRMTAMRAARDQEAKGVLNHPLDDLVPPAKLETSYGTFAYDKSGVADYLAKVIFGNHMDYEGAVKFLKPGASDRTLIALAIEIENNENVQRALSNLFRALGIDDESRVAFVKEIWMWFYSQDNDLKLQASRILAKIFFGEDKSQPQAETLKIEGLEKGLQQMFEAPAEPAKPEEPIQTDAYIMLEGRNE